MMMIMLRQRQAMRMCAMERDVPVLNSKEDWKAVGVPANTLYRCSSC
jgi:hypothetical protein